MRRHWRRRTIRTAFPMSFRRDRDSCRHALPGRRASSIRAWPWRWLAASCICGCSGRTRWRIFGTNRNAPERTSQLFLQQYEADPDGKIVLDNVDVLLLNSRPVGEGRHLHRLLTAGPNRRGGVEVESRNLGHVLATGSGADGMEAAVGAVDTYAFGRRRDRRKIGTTVMKRSRGTSRSSLACTRWTS